MIRGVRSQYLKASPHKETILVVISGLILICPFLWLLYFSTSQGKNPFSLSYVAIDLSFVGWLWAILGSFSLVCIFASCINLARSKLIQAKRYRNYAVLTANALVASSLFLSVLLFDLKHVINAEYESTHGQDIVGNDNGFCMMLIEVGSAVAVIVLSICLIATVIINCKQTSECNSEQRD